jgi:TatD DNase family protein
MPRERVVPESDGPFARVKGKPVLPWETELVATQLSSLWSVSVDNVDRILMDNLEKLL